jgi:hypothetical protein
MLISGKSAWSDWGAYTLGMFADMLGQLGRIAIAVGIGVEAIKDSLATLNPVLLICLSYFF